VANGFGVAFSLVASEIVVTSPQSRPSDAEIALGKPQCGLFRSYHSGVERHAHADASNAGLV
jgi:hypothetical protein